MNERSSRPFWLGEDKRQWDHVRIHIRLWVDERMTADHIAVYGAIAIHAEVSTGMVERADRPSAEQLGEYVSRTDRHVYKILNDLEDWKYIERNDRPGKASVLRLLPPPDLTVLTPEQHSGVDVTPEPRSDLADATPEQHSGVVGTAFRGGANEVQTSPEPHSGVLIEESGPQNLSTSEETSRERDARASEIEEQFARFWERYPARNTRKLGKAKAEKIFGRLTKAQRERAMKAVHVYRQAIDKGETLAKDAFRWLRDSDFDDWLMPTSSNSARKPDVEYAPCTNPECVNGRVLEVDELERAVSHKCETCGGRGHLGEIATEQPAARAAS